MINCTNFGITTDICNRLIRRPCVKVYITINILGKMEIVKEY